VFGCALFAYARQGFDREAARTFSPYPTRVNNLHATLNRKKISRRDKKRFKLKFLILNGEGVMMVSNNELMAASAKPVAQTRNIALDTFFYDLTSLSDAEKADILGFPDNEGSIVVVSPRDTNKPIRHYADTTHMLAMEKPNIGGIAVAGVGSSIFGTAALARNVADTYGKDIAGIVSGYGATDLVMEALGGWFFYGYADKFRHVIEIIVEKATAATRDAIRASADASEDLRESWIPRQLDSGTLFDILRSAPDNMNILVGHSKGALLIDFVLAEFVRSLKGQAHRYYDDLHVVTVGAVVGVPRSFKKTSQIIGALDWFGGINSLPDLLEDVNPDTRPKYIPNAWHQLSLNWPCKLCLVDALRMHVPLH
jgi:hypothetical protein